MCCIWKYQQIMVTFILTLNKDDEKSRKRWVRKDEMSKRCWVHKVEFKGIKTMRWVGKEEKEEMSRKKRWVGRYYATIGWDNLDETRRKEV